jgi:site-specific DNA-methyltransferase (adenine-specific)
MNKKWDYDVPDVALWREVLRVLKPGAQLLSFGGTRTYHRMVVNIEDAGFEIRDQIQWLYGSGFPKSLDISKAIDKQAGAEREVVGMKTGGAYSVNTLNKGIGEGWHADGRKISRATENFGKITIPATEAAKQWEGWGTALKPANEPIVLARKPLEKGLTVADNVLKWGTGGLNIDASRIGTETRSYSINGDIKGGNFGNSANQPAEERDSKTVSGRFPANLILDEVAAEMLDAQTGELKAGVAIRSRSGGKNFGSDTIKPQLEDLGYGGEGGASRFFQIIKDEPCRFVYVAKASKSERNKGLEDTPLAIVSDGREKSIDNPFLRGETERKNTHPTVKPVKLMEYLVRLVTPQGGIVLDPFMGSGTTGVACKQLGIEFLGIELDPAYFEIARRRAGVGEPC